ncbi:MAG: transglutaminase domain-containing protein, partial [bacterium]|nr:transglutaminase domain-containing protein [bacterium]
MSFYTEHSRISDPASYAGWFDDLPSDPVALAHIVQHLCIHVLHTAKYGVELSEHRLAEVQLYPVRELMEAILHLDDRPLSEPREPERRLLTNCRQYALLLCSMLRHKGIPARLRCGFETYLHRRRYGDHWVCEYWNEGEDRWVLVDAELDEPHREAFKIAFDPLDMPDDAYYTAGAMWQRCRDGRIDPAHCGFLDQWGLWYVRDNVVRDLLCLNKVELHPWDGTIFTQDGSETLTDTELALTDQFAAATAG